MQIMEEILPQKVSCFICFLPKLQNHRHCPHEQFKVDAQNNHNFNSKIKIKKEKNINKYFQ
jgi:hypothetical protein